MLTLLITGAAILWMLSGLLLTPEKDNTSPQLSTVPIPKVRVQPSIAQSMTNSLVLHGQTKAGRTVTIRAETGGVIEKVLVEKGTPVKAALTLIKLAIEEREARLLEARSLLLERKIQYQAIQSLNKSGFQAETELARARAALDSATASVKMAELELKRIDVTAPITGIVDQRFVEMGDFVSRGDPLATIVDLNPMRVVAQVSEHYLGQIKVQQQGVVRLFENEPIPASVTYIGSIASEKTRTFPVELEIPNPSGLIIQGITAEVQLPVAEIRAHKVPPSVLSLLDNGDLMVKAIDSNNQIITYPVQILGGGSDSIWLGGLPEELTLVVVGHEFVISQQKVTAVPVTASDNN